MTYTLQIPQHLPAIVGINEAHIISQLRFYITSGKDDGLSTDDDGRLWLSKKYSAWETIFTWISGDTIRRLFNKLRIAGYVDIRQCRDKNCFALTADGEALFDDYTPQIETRQIADPEPKNQSGFGKSPTQTRQNATPASANRRPLSIYNINNLISDDSKLIDSHKEESETHPSANQIAPGTRCTFYDWWIASKGQLQHQLNKSTFETWIDHLKFISFVDGTLTLQTRNTYDQEWISKRLAHSIMRIYSDMSRNQTTRLELVTDNHPAIVVDQPPTNITAVHAKLNPSALAS